VRRNAAAGARPGDDEDGLLSASDGASAAQPGDWRDTVQIPVGGNVTVRLTPTDWTG
jgi:hypothetical protein